MEDAGSRPGWCRSLRTASLLLLLARRASRLEPGPVEAQRYHGSVTTSNR